MDNPLMFPTTHNVDGNAVIDGGITLRDHFAGLAMCSLIQICVNGYDRNLLAEDSYKMADAMLKARKEVKP